MLLFSLASTTETQGKNTLAERKTVPEVGWSSPAINLSMVDLPMPFGPTTAEEVGSLIREVWCSCVIEHIKC